MVRARFGCHKLGAQGNAGDKLLINRTELIDQGGSPAPVCLCVD